MGPSTSFRGSTGLTDSFAFCWKLLHETKVGIAPGVAFGAGGEGSLRICYAAERAILEPAMDRLVRFLSHLVDLRRPPCPPPCVMLPIPSRVLTIIMGGGQGARLFPLTRERAKPAVPLAGKYRLVDIPISNSINSGMRRIYLLTQFLSASLHRHVYGSFKFDHFSPGFVEILAAEQSHTDASWYQGTADAVRKNLDPLPRARTSTTP